MNYKFTDLNKAASLLGFESGVYCIHPSTLDKSFGANTEGDFPCLEPEFYKSNYGRECPSHYDPRTRPWYKGQKVNRYTTSFTSIYKYSSGELGITACVPLQEERTDGKYYGAYCMDQYPTAANSDFLSSYYRAAKDGNAHYLMFTDKADYFANGNYTDVKASLDDLIFKSMSLQVLDIKAEDKKVDGLNSYIDQLADSYDLDRVAKLPTEPIKQGTIKVRSTQEAENQAEPIEYIYILDELDFNLVPLRSSIGVEDYVNPGKMSYYFMLVLPKSVIEAKITKVKEEVNGKLTVNFILAFVLVTLLLMILTSCGLRSISKSITSPIIELYEKIKLIINFHQKEKEQLIQQQQELSQKTIKKKQKSKERSNKDFDITLNYTPTNHEINQLYLAFSKLTKTIKVARNSLYEGDDNLALLNYHEVSQIFSELKNREKEGSCINNLGCIYIKKNQFENAIIFLDEAIMIQYEIIEREKLKAERSGKEMRSQYFVMACRHYNKGLACYRYIM